MRLVQGEEDNLRQGVSIILTSHCRQSCKSPRSVLLDTHKTNKVLNEGSGSFVEYRLLYCVGVRWRNNSRSLDSEDAVVIVEIKRISDRN